VLIGFSPVRGTHTRESPGPPIPVTSQTEEGRADHYPNERRVNQYSDCQGEAEHLDHQEVSQSEAREHYNHDCSGTGDQTSCSCQTLRDGLGFTQAALPSFENSCDQKHFVIHAQTKHDREG
jgi:hypothetical protein